MLSMHFVWCSRENILFNVGKFISNGLLQVTIILYFTKVHRLFGFLNNEAYLIGHESIVESLFILFEHILFDLNFSLRHTTLFF